MTALTDSLALAVDLRDVPESDELREAYRIDGPGSAAWAMRKLRDARIRQAEVRAVADAEIERVQAWADTEHAKHERDAAWFESILTRWALDCRAADPRAKTVSTPYGTVTTRETAGAWTVDDAVVLAWARASRPELVQVRESLRLADAKRMLTVDAGKVIDADSGEVVPGIEVGPSRVTAAVKLAGVS
jgi:Bacteriophage Mu Gam like protein